MARRGRENGSGRGHRLGRAIKIRRAVLDMSRKDLARAAGLSYSYLAEIENGSKQPSGNVLERIAAALRWTVSELHLAAEGGLAPSREGLADRQAAPSAVRGPPLGWVSSGRGLASQDAWHSHLGGSVTPSGRLAPLIGESERLLAKFEASILPLARELSWSLEKQDRSERALATGKRLARDLLQATETYAGEARRVILELNEFAAEHDRRERNLRSLIEDLIQSSSMTSSALQAVARILD